MAQLQFKMLLGHTTSGSFVTDLTLDEAGRTTWNVSIVRLIPYRRSGIPSLSFVRFLGKTLTAGVLGFADASAGSPWDGKQVQLWMDPAGTNTLVFAGDVVGHTDRFVPRLGWVREYECAGLAKRADYIPVTDPVTTTDLSTWNSRVDDPAAIPAREGKTVAYIVGGDPAASPNAIAGVLNFGNSTSGNGYLLNQAGIGGFGTFGTPLAGIWNIPSQTLTDLSALTFMPQAKVTLGGERILQAIEGFIQQFHPNHCVHVQPDGIIRFLDQRTFAATTLTLGSDPRLDMPEFRCDYSECYSRVEVRGEAQVQGVEVGLKPQPGSAQANGGLIEDFAWGPYTSAQAKQTTTTSGGAGYSAADWQDPTTLAPGAVPKYGSVGTVTCPSTTTVTFTSSKATEVWTTNQWAPTGKPQANIILRSDTLNGAISEMFSARITANTALSAGGTSTITLDRTMSFTSYNSAQIYGNSVGPGVVYTRYKVVNSLYAHAMVNFFPYPWAYAYPYGAQSPVATLVSVPTGTLIWKSSTIPVYTTGVSVPITVDPDSGYIYFAKPTALVFGGGTVSPCDDVRALLAVNIGNLTAWAPSSTTDAGTFNSILSLKRTKVITVHDWVDYGNQAAMNTFAAEWLDSSKDIVFEGTVPYRGLLTGMLTFGQAIQLAASGYTTGLESTPLPVIEAVLDFHEDDLGATTYTMALNCSNRRQRYSADVFIHPPLRPDQALIGGQGLSTEDFTRSLAQYDAFANLGALGKSASTAAAFQEAGGIGEAAAGGEGFLWGPGPVAPREREWSGPAGTAERSPTVGSWGPDRSEADWSGPPAPPLRYNEKPGTDADWSGP